MKPVITGNGTMFQAITGEIMRNIPVGYNSYKKRQESEVLDRCLEHASDYEKNEALLDLHCGEITQGIAFNLSKDDSMFDVGRSNELDTLKPINDLLQHKSETQNGVKIPLPLNSKPPRMNSCLPRFNINLANKPLKRNPIDPQKKSKLLAQLKSIESGNGCL